jgi:soluble lytic murein transglycosylase-like protein
MRRTIVLVLGLWLAAVSLSETATAEILVYQDKEGKITITNEAGHTSKKIKARKGKSGTTIYISSVNASNVPVKYLKKIRKLAKKYGVKESLITAVARAESGFNPFAVSKKGAVGIMQLMVDTARRYGVVNRYNADQNLEAGVRHLKYLSKKYNHNIPLILAAYNAGEDAVKKYRGVPPYKETRTFIKRVMVYMGMSYSRYFNTKPNTKIYQYRTPDGKIMITDTYPGKAAGEVTELE